MAGGFPWTADLCNGLNYGTLLASSIPSPAISGVSAHTKGSWVSLGTATRDAAAVLFCNTSALNSGQKGVADLGIGASQSVVINNLFSSDGANGAAASLNISSIFLPINIPAGTQLYARSQGPSGSQTYRAQAILFDGGFSAFDGYAGVDCLGFNSASTTGTTVTAGTSGAKGSYAQIIAATQRDYAAIWIGTSTASAVTTVGMVDVAIGAAGSEQVIIPNMAVNQISSCGVSPGGMPMFPIRIPAGTRLAIRKATQTASVTGGYVIYAAYR